jgi:CDP-2,3-bis-(O-geranylgeranyl)-sn-glycerol synthase
MLLLAAQALYLFAPLLFAAAVAAVVQRCDLLAWLRRPIDAGKTLGGKRWLGDSKTWRGVVIAVAGCTAAAAIQKHVVGSCAGQLALVDYRNLDVLAFGTAMGGGAMFGELPNSFVKRRLGIAPGKTAHGPLAALFYVWDQIDILTIAWPLISSWLSPTAGLVAMSFAVALLIHPAVSLVGYLVGARRTPR